ncbi:class I SAM-dependent methyltransferase, partial [Micrococcus luteus]|uniref:class I SAM-dependent methyltransferase n=1 Tax=Micrococcus luteus TaxID=1270 RepID=UPI000A65E965
MHPDPAEAMLRVARARAGGDRVEWRRGTAELIEPASADLVIMSGNVAMHLIDQDWQQEPTERTTAAGRPRACLTIVWTMRSQHSAP